VILYSIQALNVCVSLSFA